MQLDSRIESLTARQRERQPAVERPRVPAPFLSEGESPVPLAKREPQLLRLFFTKTPSLLPSKTHGNVLALTKGRALS